MLVNTARIDVGDLETGVRFITLPDEAAQGAIDGRDDGHAAIRTVQLQNGFAGAYPVADLPQILNGATDRRIQHALATNAGDDAGYAGVRFSLPRQQDTAEVVSTVRFDDGVRIDARFGSVYRRRGQPPLIVRDA